MDGQRIVYAVSSHAAIIQFSGIGVMNSDRDREDISVRVDVRVMVTISKLLGSDEGQGMFWVLVRGMVRLGLG